MDKPKTHPSNTEHDSGLTLAVAQLPVSSDIAANAEWVMKLSVEAKRLGAHLVLFPEAALSGYGGPDHSGLSDEDWAALRDATERVQSQCQREAIEIVVGSAHRLGPEEKPTNCLYVVGADGAITDRYDKRMLTMSDEFFYSAGDHHVFLERRGIKLALQICYDICHPELYADLRARDVEVVLHAFYNASFAEPNILDEVGPAWLRARAADNRMFIAASNACRTHQNWASCITRPDGNICASLERDVPGVLLHRFPDDERAGWEHNFKPIPLADNPVLHRGVVSSHPRARDRQSRP